MADNNFRSSRSRGRLAQGGADSGARGQIDDPLAELARLIGQNDPVDGFGRDARHSSAASRDDAAPAAGLDWAADGGYAEQNEPVEERYEPPRRADPYPPHRPAPASRDAGYEPPVASQFSAPAPRFNGAREDARDYPAVERPRYREDQEPPEPLGRQLPAFLPRTRDDRYEYDDQQHEGSDDQYAMDDYEEEAPSSRRRSGFFVVAAVLGLAVLGTAGAFAYRAMFGGSILPSLPPIIKAEDGPNKIVPNAGNSQASTSGQAGANNAGSGEKLVSREEKPIDVPAPANAAPRVVSTIPIFPAPNAGPPGVMTTGMPGPAMSAPMAPAPAPTVSVLPPAKKIHTVAIRPDQLDGTDAAAAALPSPARTTPPRPAAMPAAKPAPAPQTGANSPLSIVPSQDGDPPAPVAARTRTALASPTASSPAAATAPAAPAGGGYAVQISSQRSEAEAQTAFHALQAKYPDQLGNRQPIVRRADLGTKGIYYRTLVGPFASMEQATGVCSSLKAAGGNCIVQRN
jgi:hypothetical protein